MVQPKITLYVDIISPFGYIAFYMLRNHASFKTVSIKYTPILLGGLHKLCNNTAPILIKNKATWINTERTRWANQFGVPIRETPPPGFPISTVNAMRVLVALQGELRKAGTDEGGEGFARALDVFWCAVWNPEARVLKREGLKGFRRDGEFDVKNGEVLKGLLASVVGDEVAGRVVGRVAEKEVKDGLIANTNEAFERGAFGLPWFHCVNERGEEEGFWGFDHLGQVVKFLGLDDGSNLEEKMPLRALL